MLKKTDDLRSNKLIRISKIKDKAKIIRSSIYIKYFLKYIKQKPSHKIIPTNDDLEESIAETIRVVDTIKKVRFGFLWVR